MRASTEGSIITHNTAKSHQQDANCVLKLLGIPQHSVVMLNVHSFEHSEESARSCQNTNTTDAVTQCFCKPSSSPHYIYKANPGPLYVTYRPAGNGHLLNLTYRGKYEHAMDIVR